MKEFLPTTADFRVESWGLGSSRSSRKGFQQTSANVPPAEDLWKEYFTNVMRGDEDGPWYGSSGPSSNVSSKTFMDESSTGDKPPFIFAENIDGVDVGAKGQGMPDGGFVPTVASPGAGNGTNAAMIPALDGKLVKKLEILGAGDNQNGSIICPMIGATTQIAQNAVNESAEHPVYDIGTYAWSESISPKPGS